MKKLIPIAVAIVLIAAIALLWVIPEFKNKYSYSTQHADLNEYFNIFSATEVPIVLGDELIAERAELIDGQIYLPMSLVKQYFTTRFYYNAEEQILLYTTATDIFRVECGEDSNHYQMGDVDVTYDYAIARMQNDTLYIAIDYVKMFSDFNYSFYTEPNHMQIYTAAEEYTEATLKGTTQVRTLGGVKCDILTEAAEGEKVTVLNQMETWTEIKTPDGIRGYVETKYLKDIGPAVHTIEHTAIDLNYPDGTKDYTVALGFQYVGNLDGNTKLKSMVENADGINTVSPTWFFLKGNDGDFVDLGSASYVETAHNMGIEVWGLVEDITYDVDLSALLGPSEQRAKLIDDLMSAVERYGMDGLNIDFEGVNADSAPHFLQFLRELSIKTHQAGVILSVDNYMPNAANRYYDYEEQGRITDYLVLMGYDEHWAGCGEAGSVASIGFVKNGIQTVIDLGVPSGKIINALPFYTRIWETKDSHTTDTTDSMINIENWINSKGIELNWDSETCQYYGEKVSQDTTYRVWMEEEESIAAKLNVMLNFHLGGVAGWRLGYEKPVIWTLIQGYTEANIIQ